MIEPTPSRNLSSICRLDLSRGQFRHTLEGITIWRRIASRITIWRRIAWRVDFAISQNGGDVGDEINDPKREKPTLRFRRFERAMKTKMLEARIATGEKAAVALSLRLFLFPFVRRATR